MGKRQVFQVKSSALCWSQASARFTGQYLLFNSSAEPSLPARHGLPGHRAYCSRSQNLGRSPKSPTNSKPRQAGSPRRSSHSRSALPSVSGLSQKFFPVSTSNSGYGGKVHPWSFPSRVACCSNGRKNARNATAGACAVRSRPPTLSDQRWRKSTRA